MESCRAHTIIAGTSFALLITALRDDVELPEELPETIPSAWLDNLDRYRIVLLLSTSKHGPKAIAGTAAEYELKIERRDSARYFVIFRPRRPRKWRKAKLSLPSNYMIRRPIR